MSFPIFCLHGLGSSATAFDPFVELLPQHQIIAVDFAGHGKRVNNAYVDDPLTFAANELITLIRTEQINRFGLIGHSMGGAVALLVAQAMPVSIATLILIEGNLIEEDCGVASRKLAKAQGLNEVEAIKQEIIEHVKDLPQPGWQIWAKDLVSVTPQVLQDYAKPLFKLSQSGNLLKAFRDFEGLKYYLYGDDYLGHPILLQLKNISTHHVKNAGHFVMQDQPLACARIIEPALEMTPRGKPSVPLINS